jgi:hypothetical protein
LRFFPIHGPIHLSNQIFEIVQAPKPEQMSLFRSSQEIASDIGEPTQRLFGLQEYTANKGNQLPYVPHPRMGKAQS